MCQGRVLASVPSGATSTPFSVHPFPLVQDAACIIALVTAPIRVLSTFWIVLEWKEPSSVSLHLTVTMLTNSRELHTSLTFWVLDSMRPADAVVTAVASRSPARTPTSLRCTMLRILSPASCLDG